MAKKKVNAEETKLDEALPEIADAVNTVHVKKRIRHRQSVKLHNKKLSISVICSNPYIKQFS